MGVLESLDPLTSEIQQNFRKVYDEENVTERYRTELLFAE